MNVETPPMAQYSQNTAQTRTNDEGMNISPIGYVEDMPFVFPFLDFSARLALMLSLLSCAIYTLSMVDLYNLVISLSGESDILSWEFMSIGVFDLFVIYIPPY